ncbi:polymerase alpha subunit B [Seminavis robusta]|uniref:DNA polymerase alpha subunit B n=1 Tax=Seminavis robusta TaxID=568900 RepID=A0A9N8DDH3_9STRA|nr:polymerase alpha subunit B [Seminavis robusta]|eukprot:Sro92_g047960.1 polymerase alpha subunit B (689) ;mRNA; f:15369-17816
MKTVSKDEIRQAFAGVGLTSVDQSMISKCVAFANNHHISSKSMAECWESFSLNKSIDALDEHSWQSFRSDLEKEAERNPTPLQVESCSSSGAVQTRPAMGKRQLPTVTPPAKRVATPPNNTKSAVDAVLSSTTASPVKSASPSYTPPKYEERAGAGKVILTFNPNDLKPTTTAADSNTTTTPKCSIAYQQFDTNVTAQPHRHLFTTMEDRAKALDKHLVQLEDIMMERYNIKGKDDDDTPMMMEDEAEIAPLEAVAVPRQDKICCIGRICNAAHEGRINHTSVVLEGSKHLGGARIEMDVSLLKDGEKQKDFSLFPGQIVAVEGMNSTGRKLTAHRICEGAAHGGNKSTAKQLLEYHYSRQNGTPLKIMTVAGPYTTSDNLGYDPLFDFMSIVMQEKPDVVIMVGPFVDLRHKDIQSGEASLLFSDGSDDMTVPYEAFFANKIAGLLEEFFEGGDFKTQFVLVPSLDDATADWAYPQAPFQDRVFGQRGKVILKKAGGDGLEINTLGLDQIEKGAAGDNNAASADAPFRRIHCVSNPCTLQLNEVIIGVTGTDAIFHMSADETNANLVPGSRLARIGQHMLQQRSYYPLFPAFPGANLDLKRMKQWSMPCQPDLLIVPSKLTSFARPVLGDTVLVNPGHLTKNTTGGTYGVMEIHPMKREELETAGGVGDVELDHNIPNRLHLEIRKI